MHVRTDLPRMVPQIGHSQVKPTPIFSGQGKKTQQFSPRHATLSHVRAGYSEATASAQTSTHIRNEDRLLRIRLFFTQYLFGVQGCNLPLSSTPTRYEQGQGCLANLTIHMRPHIHHITCCCCTKSIPKQGRDNFISTRRLALLIPQ